MDAYTGIVNFFRDGGFFLYPMALIFAVGVSIAIERTTLAGATASGHERSQMRGDGASRRFEIEPARDGENRVADGLAFEPADGPFVEQHVVGIELIELRS